MAIRSKKAKKKAVHPRGKQHDVRAVSLLRERLDLLARAKHLRTTGYYDDSVAAIALEQMAAVHKSEATLLRKMR